MRFFTEAMEHLSAYRALLQAKQDGVSPVSFTGVSQVHKAHLLAALCETTAPILVITGEEAEARRLCDDINTMQEAQTAWVFPAKELVLTPVEGVTTAYIHSRISALSALQQGSCRVVIASAEALMQPTISPEELQLHTITLRRDETADLKQLAQMLTACGYERGTVCPGRDSSRFGAISWTCFRCSCPCRYELNFGMIPLI